MLSKISSGQQLNPHTLGSFFNMEEQEEKEGNRVETIVKIAVLIWSAGMLTASYYEPPSGKKIFSIKFEIYGQKYTKWLFSFFL